LTNILHRKICKIARNFSEFFAQLFLQISRNFWIFWAQLSGGDPDLSKNGF